MHAFWLVLTYELLEDRHIDDVIINFFKILYLTNGSQMTLKFVESKHLTHEVQPSLVLSLYFVTWNLFVCYDKKAKR